MQNKIYKLGRDKNAPIMPVDGKKGVYKLDYSAQNHKVNEQQNQESVPTDTNN